MADEDPNPPLQPGDHVIPGYGVQVHLWRSKDADTYRCWSFERDAPVVVKQLRVEANEDWLLRERQQLEAKLLAEFTHPNLPRAYEDTDDPRPTLVVEHLPGRSLLTIARDPVERMSVGALLQLGLELSSVVGYLHRQGYLHLDVKPANVIAAPHRNYLIDLGIVEQPGPGRKELGTRWYMSPEQVRGEEFTDKTDVWGIGATLWEAAVGRRAFEHIDERFPQLEHRAPPVLERRKLPGALAYAIDSCLEPDPARRPSIQGLRDLLES